MLGGRGAYECLASDPWHLHRPLRDARAGARDRGVFGAELLQHLVDLTFALCIGAQVSASEVATIIETDEVTRKSKDKGGDGEEGDANVDAGALFVRRTERTCSFQR